MKGFFTSFAVSSIPGSAEQPPIISSLAGSSAEQPSRETAQPVKALRSITDVQWWLKTNEVVLSSSAEVMRIREVVDALSTKPKTRQQTIERFSSLGDRRAKLKNHCRNREAATTTFRQC